ncbi:MAG TPA: beta-ketoacyl-[acyl-carrier-protein] synthase II [Clostridiales bacterium]|jgi:3-oxoacyl-[acyl-carrier-protein] synthase II|nr:beta-ketoacyl-[acyl-carrier-protein] synthase II [Clostridiales bacterium]HCG35820.1 beta-ketoacyl-[acyl-carrier-protein] synthase II [Clostridiales bacterium]
MKRVVVTGLGCITPVGNDVTTFWDHLINGRHGIATITKFDASNMKVKIAAEVKNFNPELYIKKEEIRKMDLFSQYAVAASFQAMEESGIAGKIRPERLGVYIGSGIGGISTFITETEKLLTRGPARVSPFFIPMIIANMASVQVAMKYNAKGPNLPVVTACATATHAIGEAFRCIKYGYADAVIAGGAEASINPLAMAGFTNCMALSDSNHPDESSIPFDRRRSGFVMGEGAGIIVLEEYEHAKKRDANIYCEISGYGNTCDAFHITAPDPEAVGSAQMISLTLEEAKISPDEKLYINPHGTSTPLNDKAETQAIKKVFGELAYNIPISATKSMTGHMLGAAGGVEAIAAIKAIETGIVPPTVGYQVQDSDCDLDYVPNTMRKCDVDKALSLSLGFGGHNAGVLFNKLER